MRIKTLMGTIINVDRIKRSITVEGVEFGSDCRALTSKHKDGTGTITLVFDGKIIKKKAKTLYVSANSYRKDYYTTKGNRE